MSVNHSVSVLKPVELVYSTGEPNVFYNEYIRKPHARCQLSLDITYLSCISGVDKLNSSNANVIFS
jgi:hypothetical protein